MANIQNMKMNEPWKRLRGSLPKIGIRPVIDGRRQGVRESLEEQTMKMAKSAAKLISQWIAGRVCYRRHLYRGCQ